jgi:hypothetical protein
LAIIWKSLSLATGGVFCFLVGLLSFDALNRVKAQAELKKRSRVDQAAAWIDLHNRAQRAVSGGSWQEVVDTYQLLSDQIQIGIDKMFGVKSKGLSREELAEALLEEKKFSQESWTLIRELFELSDRVKFTGLSSPEFETKARQELLKWVKGGEAVLQSWDAQDLKS